MASAAMQISINGDWNPVDSEVTVLPSDQLVLDIWTDAAIPDAPTWALYCDTTLGSISGGAYVGPDDGGNILGFIMDDAVGNGIVPPAGQNGVWGGIAVFAGSGVPADTLLYDEIVFHCENIGETVISLGLVNPDTGEIIEVMDQVVIHQIPEPATIALLGLGGLLLRRKK
jgi:hypothetical protein